MDQRAVPLHNACPQRIYPHYRFRTAATRVRNFYRRTAPNRPKPKPMRRRRAWLKHHGRRMYPRSVLTFFYGSLADMRARTWVLGLKDKPRVRKARVLGFEKVTWDAHCTMISAEEVTIRLGKDGKREVKRRREVKGVVYYVSSEAEQRMLDAYMGTEYRAATLEIEILAHGLRRARRVEGRTIVYGGDTKSFMVEILGRDGERKLTEMNESAKGIQGVERQMSISTSLLPSLSPPSKIAVYEPEPTTKKRSGQPDWSVLVETRYAPVDSAPTTLTLPQSPSLRLPTVCPGPPTYHGASIVETEAMIKERTKGIAVPLLAEQLNFIFQDLDGEVERLLVEIRGLRRPLMELRESESES